MDEQKLTGNPFVGLFSSVEQAQAYAQQTAQLKFSDSDELLMTSACSEPEASRDVCDVSDVRALSELTLRINSVIERVFLITLDTGDATKGPLMERPAQLVYLREMRDTHAQDWIDLHCLEQAVFERLMLPCAADDVIGTYAPRAGQRAWEGAGEQNPLLYLLSCYMRLRRLPSQPQDVSGALDKCREVLMLNSRNCLQNPDIYPHYHLEPNQELFRLFHQLHGTADYDLFADYVRDVSEAVAHAPEEGDVTHVFRTLLILLFKHIKGDVRLGHSSALVCADFVHLITRSPALAQVVLEFSLPPDGSQGRAYESTLLGSLLCLSCLPPNEMARCEWFENPSRHTQQDHTATEHSIQQPTALLNERLSGVFRTLIKHKGRVREQVLTWLADCLHANKGRAQLSQRMHALLSLGTASDGFLLNLCSVLLRLSQPFSVPRGAQLLHVHPTYCLATAAPDARARNVHMKDLSQETSLVPPPEGVSARPALQSEYHVISEMFHMTHYALHLGFHVLHEKFLKLNQELGRAQGLYRDLLQQGGANPTQLQQIKEAVDKRMQLYLTMKAALSEPQMLEQCFHFVAASTTYLVQMATHGAGSKFSKVTFPLPETVPTELSCVPEFVGENVIDFMLFLNRFKDTLYEQMGTGLQPLLTFILVFMGDPSRMRNPHMRAHMAEGLEALMPPQPQTGRTMPVGSSFFRDELFATHPHIRQLAPCLLSVFCNIEMTGQGVEFEQKFNYRRPMYNILKFLWKHELHRQVVQELADDALIHIEDTTPPMYLRFINLLINDAIFLLDEALSYMAQIREKEEARDGSGWAAMTPRERQQAEADVRQLYMIARFHNVMGRETLHVLGLLSRDVQHVFLHAVMIDRLAGMLNYFLKHLVGDRRKDFRVKDMERLQFRPADEVAAICRIYLNLAPHDEFCTAVARDGRSYSHTLFVRAGDILRRFGHVDMVESFTSLADKIKEKALDTAVEDEAGEDAPEEFQDSMLYTLMRDPVMLPASRNIVDRSTISRHLLSDQFDPFNRQPLTMDQVIPQPELRTRIETWLAQWRRDRQARQSEGAGESLAQQQSLATGQALATGQDGATGEDSTGQSMDTLLSDTLGTDKALDMQQNLDSQQGMATDQALATAPPMDTQPGYSNLSDLEQRENTDRSDS